MLEKHCIWMKKSIYGAFLCSKRIFLEKLRPKRRRKKCGRENSFHKNKNSSKRSRFYEVQHSGKCDFNDHEYDSGHQCYANKKTKYYRDGGFNGQKRRNFELSI